MLESEIALHSKLSFYAYLDKDNLKKHTDKMGFQTIACVDVKDRRAVVLRKGNELFVTFCGSTSKRDIRRALRFWKTDYYGLKAHNGFVRCISHIDDLLVMILTREFKEGDTITYCGHSRGGSMALLFAKRFKPDFIYTYGTPHTIASESLPFYNDIGVINVITSGDIVPYLPFHLRSVGYKHVIKSTGKPKQAHLCKTYMMCAVRAERNILIERTV